MISSLFDLYVENDRELPEEGSPLISIRLVTEGSTFGWAVAKGKGFGFWLGQGGNGASECSLEFVGAYDEGDGEFHSSCVSNCSYNLFSNQSRFGF
jgi:hypothetical protein